MSEDTEQQLTAEKHRITVEPYHTTFSLVPRWGVYNPSTDLSIGQVL